jgi:hypothetical protein
MEEIRRGETRLRYNGEKAGIEIDKEEMKGKKEREKDGEEKEK